MDERKVDKHEGYGLASFHRVSGHTTLFGSEFKHQNYVQLTINRAELHRDLSHSWYFGRDELIQISMSEAQFCELITRMNMGSGTPVTLNHIAGKRMEPIPPPKSERAQHKAEFKEDCLAATKALDAALTAMDALVAAGKANKGQLQHARETLLAARRPFIDGIPFVEDSFAEAMENTVARGRMEIDAHLALVANFLGTKQLRDQFAETSPKLLEGPTE